MKIESPPARPGRPKSADTNALTRLKLFKKVAVDVDRLAENGPEERASIDAQLLNRLETLFKAYGLKATSDGWRDLALHLAVNLYPGFRFTLPAGVDSLAANDGNDRNREASAFVDYLKASAPELTERAALSDAVKYINAHDDELGKMYGIESQKTLSVAALKKWRQRHRGQNAPFELPKSTVAAALDVFGWKWLKDVAERHTFRPEEEEESLHRMRTAAVELQGPGGAERLFLRHPEDRKKADGDNQAPR